MENLMEAKEVIVQNYTCWNQDENNKTFQF